MQIRYAVAGMPIQHSLSPILAVLTANHLKQAGLEVEIEELNLLESDDVTSPMAWAWVNKKSQPMGISNRLYGDPSTETSHSRIHRLSSIVMSKVETADSDYVPHGETLFYDSMEHTKTRRGENESWISLTILGWFEPDLDKTSLMLNSILLLALLHGFITPLIYKLIHHYHLYSNCCKSNFYNSY